MKRWRRVGETGPLGGRRSWASCKGGSFFRTVGLCGGAPTSVFTQSRKPSTWPAKGQIRVAAAHSCAGNMQLTLTLSILTSKKQAWIQPVDCICCRYPHPPADQNMWAREPPCRLLACSTQNSLSCYSPLVDSSRPSIGT